MLIHATVTVTGDPAMRIACEARLRKLLSGLYLKDQVTEHHGPDALCYDLKVEGGIPFPVFAQASQEFSDLTFDAQWVNVEQGEKGGATIVNGRLTDRQSERVAVRTADEHAVHVEVGPDGRLRLALVLMRARREEWLGYALTATRDGLLRATRGPDTGAVLLEATEGAAEWALAWRAERAGARAVRDAERAPLPIENAVYRELEAVARRFVEEWIWLESGSREETAIEAERYARYGYPVAAANVRSSRLHRMRDDAEPGAVLVHSTLAPDDVWVKELVLETWARLDTA